MQKKSQEIKPQIDVKIELISQIWDRWQQIMEDGTENPDGKQGKENFNNR